MNRRPIILIAALAILSVISCNDKAKMDALSCLLPVPVSVEKIDGTAGEEISYITAPVPGAPQRVADEAYILEITKEGITITSSLRFSCKLCRHLLCHSSRTL